MDERQRKVYAVIEECRGRKRAMTARQIARFAGLNERCVRMVIADLRKEGYAVASAVNPPYGYYLPASLEEARECQAQPWSRVGEVAATARAFDRAYGEHTQGRQMVLSLFDNCQ